ncbi:hypothetical protein BJX99DRAFT_237311 [Aspergillus californicus]
MPILARLYSLPRQRPQRSPGSYLSSIRISLKTGTHITNMFQTREYKQAMSITIGNMTNKPG